MPQNIPLTSGGFKRRVVTVCWIVSLFVIGLWLGYTLLRVFMLILAGVLIAVYFHALASWFQRILKWRKSVSVVAAVVVTFLIIGGFCWFAGAKIQGQVNEMSQTLPGTLDHLKEQLQESTVGKEVLKRASSVSSSDSMSMARGFFQGVFGVLGDAYIVIFLGLFFTASPNLYTNGLLTLAPPAAKSKVQEVLQRIGLVLAKWLKGKILAMLVVVILTLIGLLIMGVPMALVLALIAGLLNFIPNFGPVIAMVPAALIGLTQGGSMALLIIGLYILVQVIESNLITPQIQKKLISMPPALIIIAQIVMGILAGGWGVLLATPLTAILLVILKVTWINERDAKKEEPQNSDGN